MTKKYENKHSTEASKVPLADHIPKVTGCSLKIKNVQMKETISNPACLIHSNPFLQSCRAYNYQVTLYSSQFLTQPHLFRRILKAMPSSSSTLKCRKWQNRVVVEKKMCKANTICHSLFFPGAHHKFAYHQNCDVWCLYCIFVRFQIDLSIALTIKQIHSGDNFSSTSVTVHKQYINGSGQWTVALTVLKLINATLCYQWPFSYVLLYLTSTYVLHSETFEAISMKFLSHPVLFPLMIPFDINVNQLSVSNRCGNQLRLFDINSISSSWVPST